MTDEPYGPEALKAWEAAMELVKVQKFSEARAMNLYSSDRIAIEKMIQREQEKDREATANANRAMFKEKT